MDIEKEVSLKDLLINKLRERNKMLELLMKKAVKIMQNPMIMRDAFRKFNFDKYVYTSDDNKVVLIEEDPDGHIVA